MVQAIFQRLHTVPLLYALKVCGAPRLAPSRTALAACNPAAAAIFAGPEMKLNSQSGTVLNGLNLAAVFKSC